MSEEVLEAETEATEQTQTEQHSDLSHLDERAREEVIKLRRENAARRVKAKEVTEELENIKAEMNRQREAKLLEDGKLKELLDAKEQELKELSPLKEQHETFKRYFEDQLEATLSLLSPEDQELINDSGWDVAKKLSWAQKLQNKTANRADGPDSKRPGGDIIPENIKLSDYEGVDGRNKLIKLKYENPKMYEMVLNLKNNKN